MKVWKLFTGLCAAALSYYVQPVQAQQFYAGVDYLQLDRTEKGGSNRDYLYSDNLASASADPRATVHIPQSVAFSSADLPFNREEGFRAFVGARLSDCARVEGSYFWLNNDWDSTNVVIPLGDYSLGTQLQNNNQNPLPTNINTLTAAVDAGLGIIGGTARRTSDLEGFEFNFIGRWQNGGFRLDPIFGLRGFKLGEQLDMVLNPGQTYQSRADNFVAGLQAGGDLGYTIYGCDCIVDFGVFGKAGLGFNSYDHAINYTGVQANAPSKSDVGLTQFAEFGGKMALTWRFFEAHAGYQVIALNGVELGGVPPDLYIIGADTAPADDAVILHGFFVGGSVTF